MLEAQMVIKGFRLVEWYDDHLRLVIVDDGLVSRKPHFTIDIEPDPNVIVRMILVHRTHLEKIGTLTVSSNGVKVEAEFDVEGWFVGALLHIMLKEVMDAYVEIELAPNTPELVEKENPEGSNYEPKPWL